MKEIISNKDKKNGIAIAKAKGKYKGGKRVSIASVMVISLFAFVCLIFGVIPNLRGFKTILLLNQLKLLIWNNLGVIIAISALTWPVSVT